MIFKRSFRIGLALIGIVASLAIGCDNKATAEANKLIDEGNVLIKKNGEMAPKAAQMFDELLGASITKVEDFEEFKSTNKAKFDELASLYTQMEKNGADAAAKFEAAAKLDVSPKFKEYNTLKAQELKKRAEVDKTSLAFVKAFLAETDVEKMDAQIGDYNKKSADMVKEANDIGKKADQIPKDNPSEFKSN